MVGQGRLCVAHIADLAARIVRQADEVEGKIVRVKLDEKDGIYTVCNDGLTVSHSKLLCLTLKENDNVAPYMKGRSSQLLRWTLWCLPKDCRDQIILVQTTWAMSLGNSILYSLILLYIIKNI